jgi:hypothetical protein
MTGRYPAPFDGIVKVPGDHIFLAGEHAPSLDVCSHGKSVTPDP